MSKYTQVGAYEPDEHPLFKRLYNEEGFLKLTEENLAEMQARPGLKLVIFADDPNRVRETLDVVVIGPELKKVFKDYLDSCWMADVKKARAMSAQFGVKRLPAIGFFRGSDFLGAAEGLKNWDEYLQELGQIGSREKAPKRTITIMSAQAQDE